MKKEVFNGYKSEKFLRKFIPVSKNQLVRRLRKIKIKPPLVLKIISKDALHKSDINGVRIIKTEAELEKNFLELLAISRRRKLKLDGIMVQEFYEGEQLIIGIKKDPTFNHVILFGLGGIFTEVLEDFSIRKCPINKEDAQEMIDELKAKKIFYGFRGKKLNLEVLKKTLVNVSKIPLKHKNIQELDINPFILNDKEGRVVDARIVFY
ncbi:MAG: acetate--CoA ligase family protein [Nanoarchaeota archaeon]|nr:acetate--CoA ligase family protein [Nanoarchaeota archaeon]